MNRQVMLEIHHILDLLLLLVAVLLQTHILEQIIQIIVETQEVSMVVEEQDLVDLLLAQLVVPVPATLYEGLLSLEDMVEIVEIVVVDQAMELLVQHQQGTLEHQTLVLEEAGLHLVDPQETVVLVLLLLLIQTPKQK